MEDPKKNRKCTPVVNGFVCQASNDSLNQIKQSMNLKATMEKTDVRSKVTLTDQHGHWVGTAIKVGDSDIKIFTQKHLLS